MADFAFIVVIIGFFAVCAALVAGLDRIVRSGDESPSPEPAVDVTADVPAEVAS